MHFRNCHSIIVATVVRVVLKHAYDVFEPPNVNALNYDNWHKQDCNVLQSVAFLTKKLVKGSNQNHDVDVNHDESDSERYPCYCQQNDEGIRLALCCNKLLPEHTCKQNCRC